MKIEHRIISGLPNIPLTAKRFVVAHESGNPNNTGANSLDNEINFMTRNFRNAFTSHFVGGGGRIVQLAPVGRFQYGAGPKANPLSYAHVELARTTNPETFKADYAAYIWILRELAEEGDIPIKLDEGGHETKGIKSHDWIRKNLGGTDHTDPFSYLAQFGITREQFKKDVEYGLGVGKEESKPSQTEIKENSAGPAKKPSSGYAGNSIVDYLNSIKVDSSPNNRKKLAQEYGIKNYDLSASKNLELLAAMRKGKNKPVSNSIEGKRVEAIVGQVNYYDSARWTKPSGQFKKGEGWTVIEEITTAGSPQLKVKNSKGKVYYITARKDLVRIK